MELQSYFCVVVATLTLKPFKRSVFAALAERQNQLCIASSWLHLLQIGVFDAYRSIAPALTSSKILPQSPI